MRSEYGNLIREVRKAKGYTQKQLAAEAKIAINSLRRYESGERQVPIHVLKSIAEALKVNWLCLIPGVHRGAYLVEEAIQNSDMPKDAVISPFSKEYSEIVSSTIDEVGLTVIENDVHKRLMQKIDDSMRVLNDDGKQEAVKRVEELTEIPKYQLHHDPDEKLKAPGTIPGHGGDIDAVSTKERDKGRKDIL